MSTSLKRIGKQLTANRKQFGIMMALIVVAAFMWGKMLFKSAPRSASANSSKVKDATPVKGEAVELTFTPRLATVNVRLSDQSKRDLFRIDMNQFVRIESTKVTAAQNLPPKKSDEARRAEMLAKLTTLKLRSTIMQDDPRALLNDKLFQVGSEPMEGFKITRITQHSVSLKHIDWEEEFELRMYRN